MARHEQEKTKRSPKWIVMMVAIFLIAAVAVSGTIAYLISATGTVTNAFSAVSLAASAVENAGQSQVRNNGNAPVYVRATYTVNWMDASGNIAGMLPPPVNGTDYTVTVNTSAWTVNSTDGYYYYGSSMSALTELAAGSTSAIFISCSGFTGTQTVNGVTYTPRLEVCYEFIQVAAASSNAAVSDAWTDASSTTYPVMK